MPLAVEAGRVTALRKGLRKKELISRQGIAMARFKHLIPFAAVLTRLKKSLVRTGSRCIDGREFCAGREFSGRDRAPWR